MFARSTGAVYVCRRCLGRLQRQSLTQTPVTRSTQAAQGWRYATTATAAVEEQEEYHDGTKEEEGQNKPRGPPQYKDRIWAPAPAEKLGVTSLGKPAEVLVLPSRERRIPVVPHGAEHFSHHIQEALDFESKPVTPEQVSSNIEQVRDRALHTGVAPDDEVKNNLRRDLVQGFSSKQLLRYIEHTQNQGAKRFRYSGQKALKQQSAQFIVKHLWGIGGDHIAEKTEIPGQPRMINFPHKLLEAVLVQKSRVLQRLSESYNVKIDVFRNDGRLLVAPLAGSGTEALAAIHELKRSMRKRTLQLEAGLERVQESGRSKMDKFFETIGQKHEVFVSAQPTSPKLDIYYHKDSVQAVANIRREILLASRPQESVGPWSAAAFAVWPVDTVKPTVLVPAYPTALESGDLADRAWGRYVYHEKANLLLSDPLLQRSGEFGVYRQLEKTIRQQLVPSDERFSTIPVVRKEFTMDFGQYLIDHETRHLRPKESTGFMFTDAGAIPMLPQYLASRRTLNIGSTSFVPPKFLARLIFTPVLETLGAPTLEVLLSGTNGDLGFDQKLMVQRVKAVLEHRVFTLLIPGSTVDLRFRLLNMANIYETGVKTQKLFANLLGQLGNYFKQVNERERPQFSPFLNVQIPPVLLGLQTLQMGKDESRAHQSCGSRTSSKKTTADPYEYVLRSAEMLDVQSFRPPGKTQLVLDHLLSNGGKYGPSSQVLSLAGQSVWAPYAENNVSIGDLLTSGLQIAKHFSGPKMQNI